MIISKTEESIMRINFYYGEETLAKVGWDDYSVKMHGGRLESFEISEDEKLIGCELHHD